MEIKQIQYSFSPIKLEMCLSCMSGGIVNLYDPFGKQFCSMHTML